ncbi:MAG: hypothetical protein LUG57_09790 [Oscillospiraceae bacterium]|nr:hypothetical protein [Oscillospiraceae bacterium]
MEDADPQPKKNTKRDKAQNLKKSRQPKKPPRKGHWKIVLVAALCMVVALGAFATFYWHGERSDEENISTDEASKMLDLVDDIQALDQQNADADVIYAYLSSLDWIESICYEADGGISCRTEFGVTAVWSDDTDESYIGSDIAVSFDLDEDLQMIEKIAGDGLDIVILCPYASVDDRFILDGYEAAADMVVEAVSGSVTVLRDEEVSLESLKHLDEYDMVFFYSHGTLSSLANSAWDILESDPYTMTGEFADSTTAYILLSSDFFAVGRLLISQLDELA